MLKKFIKEMGWADKFKRKLPLYILIIFMWFISPSIHYRVLSIVVLQNVMIIMDTVKEKKPFNIPTLLKSSALTAAIIYGLVYAFKFSFQFGLAGLILSVLALAGWLIYKQRKSIKKAIKFFECQIFGKALDKENWQDGDKPRMPKIEWKW